MGAPSRRGGEWGGEGGGVNRYCGLFQDFHGWVGETITGRLAAADLQAKEKRGRGRERERKRERERLLKSCKPEGSEQRNILQQRGAS